MFCRTYYQDITTIPPHSVCASFNFKKLNVDSLLLRRCLFSLESIVETCRRAIVKTHRDFGTSLLACVSFPEQKEFVTYSNFAYEFSPDCDLKNHRTLLEASYAACRESIDSTYQSTDTLKLLMHSILQQRSLWTAVLCDALFAYTCGLTATPPHVLSRVIVGLSSIYFQESMQNSANFAEYSTTFLLYQGINTIITLIREYKKHDQHIIHIDNET